MRVSYPRLCRALLLGLAALALLAPATALACGPYIPLDGDMELDRERGLVIWDGTTEQSLMELAVTGDAHEAAWLFPSPTPATVELGDSSTFSQLDDLTRPQVVIEHRPGWPSFGVGAAAPPEGAGASVDVLSQQRLGPFEVTTLAANVSGALLNWLTENGYTLPPELGAVLRPYVEQGWFYVAVKLAPEAQGEALSGQLDPLWITFETDKPVYTMRATATSHAPVPFTLYVFAPHRVEKAAAFGQSEVAYADWVEPASLPERFEFKSRLPGRLFLTKFRETIDPALVNDDYFFRFAAQDETYHETITQVEYDDYTWLIGLCCCALLLVGGAAGAVVLVSRRRAKPQAAGSGI
jgi:hypothetical protein